MQKLCGILGLVLTLAACSGGPFTPGGPKTAEPGLKADVAAQSATWNIVDIGVDVSEDLRVNEANLYYPTGQIVWREDPPGDRRAQVRAIMERGIELGTRHVNSGTPVRLDITQKRFHALSQKARYSVGGVHNLIFDITVVETQTGRPLIENYPVEINLDAYGGDEALAAEAQGLTQKRRILARLISEMREIFPAGRRFDAVPVDELALSL